LSKKTPLSPAEARRAKEGFVRVPADAVRLHDVCFTTFAFSNKYTAFNFEKYLKSGLGRAFIKKHNLMKNEM